MTALAGRRILVTRPPDEAGGLGERLRAEGAVPIEAPAIEIEPVQGEALERLDGAARELVEGRYDWVAFTSIRAVDAVLGRLAAQGYGPFPQVVQARLAAVGPATAERLAQAGLPVQLVPTRFTTEQLAAEFPSGPGRVLLPRADVAPPELERSLAAKGWAPVRVDAYRTVFPERLPEEAERALRDGEVDAIVFTSASTVRGFVRAAGPVRGPKVVCIGPVTALEAMAGGLDVDETAEPHTIEGLIAALERLFERTSTR